MTDAIAVLETLACLRAPATDEQIAALVHQLPEAQRAALLARDGRALAALLGGRAAMACAVMLPDNDEPLREVPDEHAPDEQDSPARNPDADAA